MGTFPSATIDVVVNLRLHVVVEGIAKRITLRIVKEGSTRHKGLQSSKVDQT